MTCTIIVPHGVACWLLSFTWGRGNFGSLRRSALHAGRHHVRYDALFFDGCGSRSDIFTHAADDLFDRGESLSHISGNGIQAANLAADPMGSLF